MSNTVTAVLLLVIGAVLAYLVPRILPRIGRFLRPPQPVRTHVEYDPEPAVATHDAAATSRAGSRLPNVSAELDPGVFERGFPNGEAYSYVFRQDIAAVGPPPSGVCRDWRDWARARAGV